ncbi:MAG: hypothetical protein J6K91_05880 [Opitutales bacterium]|nr:hypothetical protein [Opitutales bacterium]
MEKQIDKLEERIAQLEQQLILAKAFTDPKWTDENIKAVFARNTNNDEFIQAILALIDRAISDIVMEASNPNSTELCRTHGMGGVFWLSSLATDIQKILIDAKKSVFDKLAK